jgi:hypothetical protein
VFVFVEPTEVADAPAEPEVVVMASVVPEKVAPPSPSEATPKEEPDADAVPPAIETVPSPTDDYPAAEEAPIVAAPPAVVEEPKTEEEPKVEEPKVEGEPAVTVKTANAPDALPAAAEEAPKPPAAVESAAEEGEVKPSSPGGVGRPPARRIAPFIGEMKKVFSSNGGTTTCFKAWKCVQPHTK